MFVAKPSTDAEPCVLEGNRYEDLYLYDLEGNLVVRQNNPYEGWTYHTLETCINSLVGLNLELAFCGFEAYLGVKSRANIISVLEQ